MWGIFFGDTHIGDKSGADDFRFAERKFEKFIRYVERANFIIGGGDIFELMQTSIYKIGEMYADLIQLISSYENFRFIPGNHDFPIENLIPFISTWRIPNAITTEIPGAYILVPMPSFRILVLHGHQFDKFNRGEVLIGRAAARIAGWLERRWRSDIDTQLLNLYYKIEPHQKQVEEYDKLCAELAQRYSCQAVIHGHDHEAHECAIGNIQVLDWGSWVGEEAFEKYPFIELTDRCLSLQWWS